MFFNGSASAGLTINLTGTVADGDVFVLAQSAATLPSWPRPTRPNSSGWFNGDDTVVLRKGTRSWMSSARLASILARNGVPAWSARQITPCNVILRFAPATLMVRMCSIPAAEWAGLQRILLVAWVRTPPIVDPHLEPKINEFSASTVGTDIEYVEVLWILPH